MAYVKIDSASSGANTLVAAVTGRQIRVIGFGLVATGAVTIVFKSATTALTGVMSLAANQGLVSPPSGNSYDPLPQMITASGEALILTLGTAVQVSGWLVYDLV